jgi:hypothetical protein
MLVILFVASVAAWAQLDTATMLGTVYDSSGAVLPNASIVVQNQGTAVSWSLHADASGNFIATALPVGMYRVTASAQGFGSKVLDAIEVRVSDRVKLDITLQPGAASEKITVEAATPLVDTASTTLGEVMDTKQIQDLPLNGRNLSQLVGLIPGVVLQGTSNQYSVNGASATNNDAGLSFLLDGGDASRVDSNTIDNTYSGSQNRLSRASVDAVQEFRVYANSFSAEFGNSMGAVVNLITKSGSNGWHGSLFEYLRNEKLDTRSYFNAPPAKKPPYRLNQFGGSFGGPIIKDKLFFFINYEAIRQRKGTDLLANVPTAAFRATLLPVLQPVVAMLPLPNGPVSAADPRIGLFTESVSNPLDEDSGAIKIDYQISSSDRISGRYTADGFLNPTYFGVGKDQISPIYGLNQIAKLTWTHIVSPRALNEAGANFNRMHIDPRGANSEEVLNFPRTSLGSGVAGVGPTTFDLQVANNSFSYLDTFSYTAGRHQIRTGVQVIRNQDNKASLFQEAVTYQTLDDFVKNSPFSIATSGQPRAGLRNTYFNAFVQDDFQWNRHVTLNIGLRYQYDTAPTESHGRLADFNQQTGKLDPVGSPVTSTPKTNFAPRFGIAWSPSSSNKTVIRAGFGLFYSSLNASRAQNLPNNIFQEATTITRQQMPNLVGFPFPAITSFASILSLTTFNPQWKTAYTEQWNFNIQRGIGSRTVLQVTYLGNRGMHLNGPAQNINRLYAGTSNRPWPAFGNINLMTDWLNSFYSAMQVSLNYRLAKGLTFSANYTWAHSLDDNPTLFGTFQDDSNPRMDWASSDFDVRHVFKSNLNYALPGLPVIPRVIGSGWQTNLIATDRAGFPVNVTCGCDSRLIGATTARPDYVPGVPVTPASFSLPNNQVNLAAFKKPANLTYGNVGRNILAGPGAVNFDFSMFKSFRVREHQDLQFRAEAFNIFNHPQFAQPGANLSAPANFGKSLATVNTLSGFGSNRQVQLGLRYAF